MCQIPNNYYFKISPTLCLIHSVTTASHPQLCLGHSTHSHNHNIIAISCVSNYICYSYYIEHLSWLVLFFSFVWSRNSYNEQPSWLAIPLYSAIDRHMQSISII